MSTASFSNASLYVGDLDPSVGDEQLFELFSQVGKVLSVRVCRDYTRQRASLGYAYVNFLNRDDASAALRILNFITVNGKTIRIMFSHRDPSIRKSGFANVFIKNLESSIDNKALLDTFASFGDVLSCKIAVDSSGRSKGYGFVQFDREESAKQAIAKLNGMMLNDKQVYVGVFVRRQERSKLLGLWSFTNVYVKNLGEDTTEEDLRGIFGMYGAISNVAVMRDGTGKSRCFGFVNFHKADDAAAAVQGLNGTARDDKVLFVGKAQRKTEREAELRARFQREKITQFEKLHGANLYLKNLDDSIDDEKLRTLFSTFGTITSSKVVADAKGRSIGSGFVAFSSLEEASRAIKEMNGKMIGRKPLYVAVAQRKQERRARLQAHFAQQQAKHTSTLNSAVAPFHPVAQHTAPQQIYYGQGTPSMLPPQHPGYGYQQQLVPAIRPGIPQNYIVPYNIPRQSHLPVSPFYRTGNAQHQFMNRSSSQSFRYVTSPRNEMESGFIPQGAMVPMAYEVGMPVPGMENQRLTSSMITSSLASATPEMRFRILGEQLYPLVENYEPGYASKVTGMLLEMDQNEVLHLIESPDALGKKVEEAMDVLRASRPDVVNGMLSMSINE